MDRVLNKAGTNITGSLALGIRNDTLQVSSTYESQKKYIVVSNGKFLLLQVKSKEEWEI
jgi:hypothetical protein